MSMTPKPSPDTPRLIDPDALEAAGRSFRRWLEALKARTAALNTDATGADDIAWEDGEPARRDIGRGEP